MATQLDQATRDAVMAEANARAKRFGISQEQALYNYARENNISNADVDTYMGYAPGSADAWVRQRDAGMAAQPSAPQAQQPAPQGNVAGSAQSNGPYPLVSFGPGGGYDPWAKPAPQGNSYTAPVAAPNTGGLTSGQIAEAKQWATGRNVSEIASKAREVGLSADQLGSVFGVSGDTVRNDFGYGTAGGYNGAGATRYFDGANWGDAGGQQAATGGSASKPLYTGLSNNSNAADIAAAYREWADANGGDTTENQRTAEGYLSNLGLGSGSIRDAYSAYKGQTGSSVGNANTGGNLGLGDGYNPQQNPYLRQMGVDVGNQMFDQWSRNTLPSIRSGAMAAGGFGGSRQGVVEANGINDMQRNYGQALTSMYGNDWGQQQGRNLQQQGLNNSYDLGLRSNDLQNRSVNNSYDLGLRSSDLGFANLDANIAQNNFGNQMSAANFGLGVYNTMNGQTQQGINAGTNIQNTPLDYQKYFSGSANAAGGMGGTNSGSTATQSNPYLGAVAGAQLGNAFQYPRT